MRDNAPLENPTNRLVAAFHTNELAEHAIRDCIAAGISREEIRLLKGSQDARQIDTSPKWFADTDVDIARFRRALEDEQVVISVPVGDEVEAETVKSICQECESHLLTHFGTWVTEVMG